MSGYMSRLFPRSNSSFFLCSGNALQSKVVRLREQTYLIDAGVGPSRICTVNELIRVPKSDGPARFTNKVGFLNQSSRDSAVKMQMLERCFVDLVTGDSRTKDRAVVRFSDMLGHNDAVGDEQKLLMPRKFRKYRAFMELKDLFRRNAKVKGFVTEKVRGGHAVAIAGYIAFLPLRPMNMNCSDQFFIETINSKKFVVARAG